MIHPGYRHNFSPGLFGWTHYAIRGGKFVKSGHYTGGRSCHDAAPLRTEAPVGASGAGDVRGKQSAALLIVSGDLSEPAWGARVFDLRVDIP